MTEMNSAKMAFVKQVDSGSDKYGLEDCAPLSLYYRRPFLSKNTLFPAILFTYLFIYLFFGLSFVITAQQAQRSRVAAKVTWNRTGSGNLPCH